MINAFEDLMIVIGDTPVKLNVIGLLRVGEDDVVVITDCPPLEIGDKEYELFHLILEEGKASIRDIEDDTLYEKLCNLWEVKIMEDKENDS